MWVICLFLFIIISLLNLSFEFKNNKKGRYYTKPLLMPLLILFYITIADKINYLIILALLCGFSGDVFLMRDDKEKNILLGITSFLIGHLLYITVFLSNTSWLSLVPSYFYMFIIPYITLELYLLKKLLPTMGSLKIPGFIYTTIILFMSFTSLSRIFNVSFMSFLLPFIGSISFILSDTVLAFSLFKKQGKYDNIIVMITYITSQFLITLGFIL